MYVLDSILIHVIGAVNVAVFRLSRGRVVLHRYRGVPHVRLTQIGEVPELDPPSVDYLRDGDDYVLLVPTRVSAPRWLREVREATSVTLEVEEGNRSEVVFVIEGEADAEEVRRLRERVHGGATTSEMDADVFPVVGEAEQATAAAQLLKSASLEERYEVRKQRLVPVVRLKAR